MKRRKKHTAERTAAIRLCSAFASDRSSKNWTLIIDRDLRASGGELAWSAFRYVTDILGTSYSSALRWAEAELLLRDGREMRRRMPPWKPGFTLQR